MDFTGLLGSAAAALSSTNTALDVVKKARNLFTGDKQPSPSESTLQLKLALDDIADRLIAARDAIAALTQANRELQEENMRLKNFQVERENYELRSIDERSFAYVAKGAVAGDKHTPYYCAACFERSQKSILQFMKRDFHRDTLRCSQCGAEVFCANDNRPEVFLVPVANTRWNLDDI